MEHKYVRTKKLGFIIWPKTHEVHHSHIGSQYLRSGKLISAGFAEISGGKVRCYGYSESLGLRGLEDDTEELASQLGLSVDKDRI